MRGAKEGGEVCGRAAGEARARGDSDSHVEERGAHSGEERGGGHRRGASPVRSAGIRNALSQHILGFVMQDELSLGSSGVRGTAPQERDLRYHLVVRFGTRVGLPGSRVHIKH